jgi:hypothetical protein
VPFIQLIDVFFRDKAGKGEELKKKLFSAGIQVRKIVFFFFNFNRQLFNSFIFYAGLQKSGHLPPALPTVLPPL